MTARGRLPDRRPCLSLVVEHPEGSGVEFRASLGFDPVSGEPRELFINSAKVGSSLDVLLADAAVLASVALQYGVPLDVLRLSLARAGDFNADPESAPRASALGAVLDAVANELAG